MDLSAFEARYGDKGPGNQAFDPRMMVKVQTRVVILTGAGQG